MISIVGKWNTQCFNI